MKRFTVMLIVMFICCGTKSAGADFVPEAVYPDFNSETMEAYYYTVYPGGEFCMRAVDKACNEYVIGVSGSGIIDFDPTYGIKVGNMGGSCNGLYLSSFPNGTYYGPWYIEKCHINNQWQDPPGSLYHTLDNSVPLNSQVACTSDLWTSYPGFSFQNVYHHWQTVIMESNWSGVPAGLTVVIEPTGGGGVASYPVGDGIYCGIDGYNICQMDSIYGIQVMLDAYPNDGYEFAYWEWNEGASSSINNPEMFTMDQSLKVTAVFKKTFRCAAEDFRYAVDTEDVGQCVEYVRDETDIEIYGNAYTWYQSAINSDYLVGSTPEVSSIIVFDSQPGMLNGHVGIVKKKIDSTHLRLRDSNWCTGKPENCEDVEEHIIDINQYAILGYIYCTPPN